MFSVQSIFRLTQKPIIFISALLLLISLVPLSALMQAATCPCTVFASTDSPATANVNDANSVELGMKFRADTDGYIKAVRFYKGSQNTGTHTGNLWTTSGTNLATVTFSGESASGWQQANFNNPVAVTANTTYIVSYFAPNGYYSADGGYFSSAKVNGPLTALADGTDGGNGVYRYGSTSGFPSNTYNSTNYWVDVVFDASTTDTTAPTISSTVPAKDAAGVSKTNNIQAFFSEAMDPATINSTTVELRDPSGTVMAAVISYDSTNKATVIDPNTDLANTTTYTVVIKGGISDPRVKDLAGNAMAANYSWSFTTTGPGLEAGPGGPILVLGSDGNPFSRYYAEILRGEGFNNFAAGDIANLSTTMLAAYDVVILGDLPLTDAQVTVLTDWVNAGGNLIVSKPDKKLANLSGLSDAAATRDNAYLLVDNSKSPGKGIVGETIQYHGTADLYSLNGASAVATLYSDAATATANPAVTLRNVGTNGGQVGTFTYDLARSIVYTRQGNPAWAGQERDGNSVIRATDMFYGNAAGDPQPDWVNLDKVAIPQADEQQRLLSNMITSMNMDKKPLPRFWYLPGDKKAVIVHALDDHGTASGTKSTFDKFNTASPAGCSVADWQCYRATSWHYTSIPLTDSEAAAYNTQGHETGIHVNSGCQNFTNQAELESVFTSELNSFATKYPSVPAQRTNRTHCIPWSDWDSMPKAELNHGIRYDMGYYYWPASWVLDRPGFFTGSGMPQRYTQMNGQMLDVYQGATNVVNENGLSYPAATNAMLDKALGPEGYYGVMGTHDDYSDGGPFSDSILSSAQTRGVSIVTARQMLDWLDGRNASSYKDISWSNNTLSFSINQAPGAKNLSGMLPMQSANGTLQSISKDGISVSFARQTIKGVSYAFFPAESGNYTAQYSSTDTTAPTVTSVSPKNDATGVSADTNVAVTFSEAMDAATIDTNSFELRDSSGTVVSSAVSYDAGTQTATLDPVAKLGVSTKYTVTVRGGTTDPRVKDLAGNALAADYSWSFTTAAAASNSISIFAASATPSKATVNDGNAVELGVKFRSDVAGEVTAVRFYKGDSTNSGTHIGNLWSSTGTKLASVTFSGETSSGWQQANFATPVAISANTTYIVSYHAPKGYYSADNNFFALSGVSNPPLYALKDGEDGGNGVYKYSSTSAFPANTYKASNYWVDVVFKY